jgi:hypothetical protein
MLVACKSFHKIECVWDEIIQAAHGSTNLAAKRFLAES